MGRATLSSKNTEMTSYENVYEKVQQRRLQIMNEMEKLATEGNELIAKENELTNSMKQLKDSMEKVKVELSKVEASTSTCVGTINLYKKVMDLNQPHIERITNHFSSQWTMYESRCHQWSTHEFVVWMQYKADHMEISTSMDWESVEERLIEHKMDGQHLPNFRQNMITFIGIEGGDVSNGLVAVIQELVQRYKAKYDALWKEKESKWMQWTSEDLTEWFRYNVMPLETGKIDWVKTAESLKAQNMNGTVLPKTTEVVFPLIGIKDKDTIDHLVSCIKTLLNRYGPKNQIKDSKSISIPKEYLCSLMKKVMKDPVFAFDGNTYERGAIESYLKEHGKSPITGVVIADTIIPNNAMKLQIEKFLSSNAINMELVIMDSETEGAVPETGYL